MLLEETTETMDVAELAIASLRRHAIPATPYNYALWFEYHAGLNPSLQRIIDAIVSNGGTFDEKTLKDLHTSFFSLEGGKQAIRETSLKVLEALQSIICVTNGARADADVFGAALQGIASTAFGQTMGNLQQQIEQLVAESQRMAQRSEYVSVRMRESSEKIETLERNLEDALRDATVDGLTGVANRKGFDKALRKLAGEAMNSGDDLSLLMIDIDHFKRVNDTCGHLAGDLILRQLALALQRTVRGDDVVARYGGEEFAVLLPRTDVGSAVKVGENIRQILDREPLQIEATPAMRQVTVSIGSAVYDAGEPVLEWIARADQALYKAKEAGRNCVKSA